MIFIVVKGIAVQPRSCRGEPLNQTLERHYRRDQAMAGPQFPVTKPEYSRPSTALLFVDPYNDFLSEGGQVWPYIKEVAEEVDLLGNLRKVNDAIRQADRLLRQLL